MARRWRRGSKDEDEDREEPARARPSQEDAEDLESRLEAVTSRFERPPTADELRAAFRRRAETASDDDRARPAADDFASRYPTESLFVATPAEEPTIEDPVAPEDRSRTTGDYYYDPEDAWAVLGLRPGASWKEIAAAHRRLAMQHHPDRLLDATPEQRRASEAAMRDVNVAYSVLRRLTGH